MAPCFGCAYLTLHLEGSFSLKDKRREVKSLTHRMRNTFNVSVAEVADLNDMRLATIAIVCVTNSSSHADQMLAEVIRFAERNVKLGVVEEISTEIIPI